MIVLFCLHTLSAQGAVVQWKRLPWPSLLLWLLRRRSLIVVLILVLILLLPGSSFALELPGFRCGLLRVMIEVSVDVIIRDSIVSNWVRNFSKLRLGLQRLPVDGSSQVSFVCLLK